MAERRKRPNARSRARQRRYRPDVPLSRATDTDDAMTETELLQCWQSRISHARRVREDWEIQYRVDMLGRFFLGHHTSLGEWGERDEIYLNHFAATIMTQRPGLLPAALSFQVEAKAGQPPKETTEAKIHSGLLDAIARQDGHMMKSLRLAMTQAFFRIGVLKVTYDPRMEPNPRAGEPLLNDEDQAMLGQSGDMLKEPQEILTDEVYRWQWVNARQLFLPDEGPDTTRWSWIAEEVDVSLEEAKEDTRFPAEVRKHLKGNSAIRTFAHLGSTTDNVQTTDEDQQRFRYYECWDIWDKRLYIWADGQDTAEFLVNEPYPDGVEDHPYALLIPIPILEPEPSPWPKPMCYDWIPIQQQYNLLRVQQINAGKRSARKILYDENTFPDADEAQKFLSSSADMQGVKVNDLQRPPLVVGDGAQSIDVSRNIPYLLADWQRVTGSTGEQLGNPQADTATQAVLAGQAAGVRESEMRTLITEWLTEAGRKMLQLVRQTLTLDMWVDMKGMGDKDFREFLASPGFQSYMALRVGEQNVPMFLQMITMLPGMSEVLKQRFGQLKPLKVTRSMLTMEADVKAVPSTIRPVYRAQLLQLVTLLGPNALLSPTLMEELLHSFELPQGDRIAEEILLGLKQQRDQAQQLQQAQVQAKMSGAVPGAAPAREQPMPGGPSPGSAANPMGTQNPLGAASAGLGG